MITPGSADAYMGTGSPEARNLSRRSIGESSSVNPQNFNNHDEQMAPTGWWSSIGTSGGSGPRQDIQLFEPSFVASRNNVYLNLNITPSEPSLFLWSSTNGGHVTTSRSHNIHVGQLDQGGVDLMGCSNSLKSGMLEHMLFPSARDSKPFASSSGSGGFLVDDDNGKSSCAMDDRRMSCKRKTIEGNVRQSSNNGSYFSREGNIRQIVPPYPNAGSNSLNISPQLETTPQSAPVNSWLELSMLGLTPYSLHTSSAESSQRTHRLKGNPSNLQDFSSHHSYRPIVTSLGPQPVQPPCPIAEPIASNIPSLQRYAPTATVGVVSMLRDDVQVGSQREREINPYCFSGISSGASVSAEAEVEIMLYEARRRALDIGSSSQAPSGSSCQSTPLPSWGSSRRQQSSDQAAAEYTRRLIEYVRRSRLSPSWSEVGGPTVGSSSTLRSIPSSSQEAMLPSGGGSHKHNQLFSRSRTSVQNIVDRHGAGSNGIPRPLCTLHETGDGRTRLVFEIHNVLDMMRRGEGLRYEDYMVLDPSILFGMADLNDQHRDMRLDVDNMSYKELLALEDRIGSVSTGINAETVATRLKRRKYFVIAWRIRIEVEPCCICQDEYTNGDDLGMLDCGHDFHTECIKQWLGQKNLCPICKITGLAT